MYAKLAVRNVARSVKDYSVYFVTLLLGVAMFYAFNTIGDQQVMLDLDQSGREAQMFNLARTVLAMLSVIVAVILAFLVLYANRFLFKRRKREFGMYLMLGMTPSKVARVVLYETLMVGLVALALGLLAGVGLSQVLSSVTAELMGETLSNYRFMVSSHAVMLTLVSFAVIFLVVSVLNVGTVGRNKLVNLFNAQHQAESFRVKHVGLRCAGFVASLVLIGLAYWQLGINGFQEVDGHFKAATILMLAGTVMFFWSVSGVVILLIQRAKGPYLRGLNMFTTRQVSSKVNTAFMSMSAVSVLLFLTITTVACGMSMVKFFVDDLEESTQFDATIRADYYYASDKELALEANYQLRRNGFEEADPAAYKLWRQTDGSMAEALASSNAWQQAVGESVQLDRYCVDGQTYADILPDDRLTQAPERDKAILESNLSVMGVSQFNSLLAMVGEEPLDLTDGQLVVNNTMSLSQDAADKLAKSGTTVSIAGIDLQVCEELASQPVQTSAMADVGLELIVPDRVIEALKAEGAIPWNSVLNVMYKADRPEGDKLLDQAVEDSGFQHASGKAYSAGPYANRLWPISMVTYASDMIAQASGFRMLITYVAVYMGLVLLICTAAVLAIQQLSETADGLPRYRKLSQLGADQKMILGSLRTQILLYFLAPLVLAAAHSACAITVVFTALFDALGVDMRGSVILAVLMVALVYGCYLVVTYLGGKSMVKTVCK